MSAAAKRTAGPWEWTGLFIEHDGSAIAQMIPNGKTEANARLIAAAPTLIETLRLCDRNVASLSAAHPNIYSEWLAVIRAAIVKAEGGAP